MSGTSRPIPDGGAGARQRVLSQAIRLLSPGGSGEAALERLTGLICKHLGVDFAGLWFRDPTSDEFRLRAHTLALDPSAEGDLNGEREGPVAGLPRLETHPEPGTHAGPTAVAHQETEWAKAAGFVAHLCVTLGAGPRPQGVLALLVHDPRVFSRREVEQVQDLAGLVLLATGGDRHGQESKLAESRQLEEIAQVVRSVRDPKEILRQVCQKVALLCGGDRATIFLWDAKKGRVVPAMSQLATGKRREAAWSRFKGLGNLTLKKANVLATIIETRQPTLVADCSASPLMDQSWVEAFSMKSFLGIPLVAADEVIGTLSMTTLDEVRPFGPRQLELAVAAADQVALALERALLLEQVETRLHKTQAHLEIARTLTSTLELKPLLQQVTRQAAKACDMERCSIDLWIDGWVVPTMSQFADGRDDPELAQAYKQVLGLPVAEVPFFSEMLTDRKPVILNDPAADPRWPAAFDVFASTVVLAVPLIRQEEIVGALVLDNTEHSDPITPDQVSRATTIASQVALAVDNARLHEETRRRLKETQAFLKMAQTIGSSLDPQEVARRSARELTLLLGADTTIFYEVNQEDGYSRGLAGYHVPPEILDGRHPRPLSEQAPFLIEAVETRKPVASTDPANDPRFDYPILKLMALQSRSILYSPVLSQGKHMGGLVSFWWSQVHNFTDEELRLAAGIADQMTLVLESARQFEKLKETQERLVQSEKFRALAGMAGGVAHDFRNLLTSILGRAEVLRAEIEAGAATSETIQAALRVIELAAHDGAETVRRLLVTTRATPQTEAHVAVDLNELLDHTKEVSRSRWMNEASTRGIWIEMALEPGDVPSVTGSPAELREVLLNLVFNAIDALPEGGRITLSTGAGEGHVWTRVEDTGIGMSREVQERIFEPFFSTKGAASTGLGLSSSYGIVHRHGGEIEVESRLGSGTRFTVRLPLPD